MEGNLDWKNPGYQDGRILFAGIEVGTGNAGDELGLDTGKEVEGLGLIEIASLGKNPS